MKAGTDRLLGLLGGMSWESTALYYRLLNQGVAARRGGLHSAPLLMHSVDFAPIAALQAAGDWPEAARRLGEAGAGLRRAGAQALLLATNTMHKVAAQIEDAAGLPVLHIADATGAALRRAGHRRAALLGTRYTMEDRSIVAQRLHSAFGVDVLTPAAAEQERLHRVIYDELCRGRVEPASRAEGLRLIETMRERGAEAVILGCTELALLFGDAGAALPVFDSTALHAAAAVAWLCGDGDSDTASP